VCLLFIGNNEQIATAQDDYCQSIENPEACFNLIELMDDMSNISLRSLNSLPIFSNPMIEATIHIISPARNSDGSVYIYYDYEQVLYELVNNLSLSEDRQTPICDLVIAGIADNDTMQKDIML